MNDQLKFVMHAPNKHPEEGPVIFDVQIENGTIVRK